MMGDALKEGVAWRWLAAAAALLTLAMVVGLVLVVTRVAGAAFWPKPLEQFTLADGSRVLGEVWEREPDPATPGGIRLRLKIGNRDVTGHDFRWVAAAEIAHRETPPDAVLVERMEYGNFYGTLAALSTPDGSVKAGSPGFAGTLERDLDTVHDWLDEEESILARADRLHAPVAKLEVESKVTSGEAEAKRLATELAAAREKESAATAPLFERLGSLREQAAAYDLHARTADGTEVTIPLADVVRTVPVNRMSVLSDLRLYVARWWDFLTEEPRESNTEGGIFPAIFGTALMVFLMTFAVVPLGVVTAVYLNEYARGGWFTQAVRLALANLAGVPSIVFGAFGLAFFVYAVGGTIDSLFFADRLPTPTFGTGGILWASLTLALLTVPVVVVATEEGLQAVPNATREGARALGATRWQSLRHVILPYAAPGILTGTILAVARAAGEVAPLMLTGVVKLAPALPMDGTPPYLHLDRKFMHLGFHIYDVGFQSPNVEAALPMVYATTLVLLALVVVLNLLAIAVRARLRRKLSRSAV